MCGKTIAQILIGGNYSGGFMRDPGEWIAQHPYAFCLGFWLVIAAMMFMGTNG
jgi:hypothetical protein